MSALRFVNQRHWAAIESHLCEGPGERFAFAYTRCIRFGDDPILEVVGVDLIPEHDTTCDRSGWKVGDYALDRVHNKALTSGRGLIELHNHQQGPPRFSPIDEAGLEPTASYMTEMLPDHPYAAGVYAQGRVHVEHWTRAPDGLRRGRFRAVTVIGDKFRVLNAPGTGAANRLMRQGDVLGPNGMGTLAGLRVAIVGAGGTGSQLALMLAYLGLIDLVVLDDDIVEESNLNRLVTAGIADIGAPKTLATRRRLREIDPALRIRTGGALRPGGDHLELTDVDIIFGCVDNDGPRDLLNQIAVDLAVPYIDIATEIFTETEPPMIGGRVIVITPGNACLHCLGELDPSEVANWAKPPSQHEADHRHGYGTAKPNPAVVHLNGLAVNAAVAEFAAWIAGIRAPAQFIDIDIDGSLNSAEAAPGTRVTPRHPLQMSSSCIACSDRVRPSTGIRDGLFAPHKNLI